MRLKAFENIRMIKQDSVEDDVPLSRSGRTLFDRTSLRRKLQPKGTTILKETIKRD